MRYAVSQRDTKYFENTGTGLQVWRFIIYVFLPLHSFMTKYLGIIILRLLENSYA